MAKSKIEKNKNVQSRMYLFKDKRGRQYYYDEKEDKAYFLLDKDVRLLIMYDARTIIALFIIVALTVLLNVPLIITSILASVTYVGIDIYFNRFVKPRFNLAKKLKEEDYATINQASVFKERKNDALYKFTMAVLTAFLMFVNSVSMQAEDLLNLQNKIGILISCVLSVMLAVIHAKDFRRANKRYKELKS